MNEYLISNSKDTTNLQRHFEDIYDPFQNPPDLKIADCHRKATKVGKTPPDLS